ncbi:hypothetical protein My1_052 [Pectobacterium phage My1]|uniref:Uncharacterized protein n=1 Tax=Pectobacterium phage My1 TaxID=1204539 RepID=J9QPS6_9CAUD|nr:hypothetical protein My1_052 [Pectobacterium phage My1]AFQ22211.1 hypothetical protein My1_052 [Pectobacterium phage My1]
MNLLLSYCHNDDIKFYEQGHLFLGAAEDKGVGEVHVWLIRDDPKKSLFPPRDKVYEGHTRRKNPGYGDLVPRVQYEGQEYAYDTVYPSDGEYHWLCDPECMPNSLYVLHFGK